MNFRVLIGCAAIRMSLGWVGWTPLGPCARYRRSSVIALRDAKAKASREDHAK